MCYIKRNWYNHHAVFTQYMLFYYVCFCFPLFQLLMSSHDLKILNGKVQKYWTLFWIVWWSLMPFCSFPYKMRIIALFRESVLATLPACWLFSIPLTYQINVVISWYLCPASPLFLKWLLHIRVAMLTIVLCQREAV